jgi:hypothetical protein
MSAYKRWRPPDKRTKTKTRTMTGIRTRLVPPIQFITHIHQFLYMSRSSCSLRASLISKISNVKKKKKKGETGSQMLTYNTTLKIILLRPNERDGLDNSRHPSLLFWPAQWDL